MTDLSARAEQAKPDEARGLLELLFLSIQETLKWDAHHHKLWQARLDCEAYLDAAMMLVPDGWKWRIMPADSRTAWLVEVWQSDDEDGEFGARGVTPALALIAAIARSIGQ